MSFTTSKAHDSDEGNPFGSTAWLAGGGVKGEITFGAADEWSYKAVDRPGYCHDLQATMLHLLGIDHTCRISRHNEIERRLTDVHGARLGSLLA